MAPAGRRRCSSAHDRGVARSAARSHDPAAIRWVVTAISALRAIRSEVNVPAGARVPLLVKDAEPEMAAQARTAPRAFRPACPDPRGVGERLQQCAAACRQLSRRVSDPAARRRRRSRRRENSIARGDQQDRSRSVNWRQTGIRTLAKAEPDIVEEQRVDPRPRGPATA